MHFRTVMTRKLQMIKVAVLEEGNFVRDVYIFKVYTYIYNIYVCVYIWQKKKRGCTNLFQNFL